MTTKEKFKLTAENYHSQEANKRYISVSQFKDFANVTGFKSDACEAKAIAKINGEWIEGPSTAMLVGSYVDSYFEGTLEQFSNENPQIFSVISESKLKQIEYVEAYFSGKLPIFEANNPKFFKKDGTLTSANEHLIQLTNLIDNEYSGSISDFRKASPSMLNKRGELKSDFKKAEEVIARIERDEFFMKHLSGEKQVIMTANFLGADWKIKMDSYIPDIAIVDLKVIKDIHERFWCKGDDENVKGYVSFVEKWGYDVQGAIYQKIVEINTGKKLPFFLAVADKGKFPDIEIVHIPQERLDLILNTMSLEVNNILKIKTGLREPIRCEHCDYCKSTKVLKADISYLDLIED